MIPCLTDPISFIDERGFSLTELMIAMAFSLLLMLGVYGFYSVSSQSYNGGISGQNLQNGASIILSKILEGESEAGTVYRLSSAVSYSIPNGAAGALYTCGGAPQATSCNAANAFSEVYYCQDSPCAYNDATARWYYLNGAGNAVIYHHPSGGGTVEETVFQAPKGAAINLRFAPAVSGGVNLPNDLEIDVDLSATLPAGITNQRLATSGDVTTFVLLRNHP